MARYSVADAKNSLPKLIDRALKGEEVVITRRGEPVVELRPANHQPLRPSTATYDWLRSRRLARPSVNETSVEILNELYESGND